MKDKDVIIIDDMIHTGTKLISAVLQLKQMGANEVYGFITHNLLYPQSFQNIEKLNISGLITTNTISNVFLKIIYSFFRTTLLVKLLPCLFLKSLVSILRNL